MTTLTRRWAPAAATFVALVLAASAAASPRAYPLPLPAGTPPAFKAMIRAKISPKHPRAPLRPSLTLKAHGYRIGVIGAGSTVVLEVAPQGQKIVTAYLARGTVTSRRLHASFGKLGEIDMRFRPDANHGWTSPRNSCRGRGRFIQRPGLYEGTLRFRGENDYLALRAHRAKGHLSSLARSCVHRRRIQREPLSVQVKPRGPSGGQLTILVADWRHAVDSATFLVLDTGSRAHFLALAEESQGKLAKVHFAVGSGSGKRLTVNEHVTSARVRPPAPFAGSGEFRSAPDGTRSWTGSLTAHFPGEEKFPLTGPLFETEILDGL